MGLSVTEEYIDPHSGYSIDMMVAPSDFDMAAGLKQVRPNPPFDADLGR